MFADSWAGRTQQLALVPIRHLRYPPDEQVWLGLGASIICTEDKDSSEESHGTQQRRCLGCHFAATLAAL